MRGPEPAPPIGRLTKRSDFVAAAPGRRFHTERMTVQGLLRPDDAAGGEAGDVSAVGAPGSAPKLRVGLTVTKRVGNAVERNRIKRRLRAALLDASLPSPDMPLDVVVVARRHALTAEYGQLVGDLERALPVVAKPRSDKPSGADRRSGSGRRKSHPSTGDERRGPSHA